MTTTAIEQALKTVTCACSISIKGTGAQHERSLTVIAFRRLPRCAVLRRRHRSPHWRLLGHGYFTIPARTNSFVPESFLLDRYFCTQVSLVFDLYEFY